ncbi:superoxide dismutase [Mn], mitochondrial [Leguminivora glycinivorella]|uniref:superoxide dismutase [Mn], mitochondrial n=1 Tax=Leguminivora glycinivorella TaxID=1035111 RepID=UPI00200F5EFF|nr:superoxide dismutase [Mn], mitochondrial [Leguminivora glycinivorella]
MFASRQIGNLMRVAGACRQKHTLPDLPYEYSALEPVISREIMALHHGKHHATYVANLNAAEEKLAAAQAKGDIDTVINLAPALKFNGGGHINHSIFWQNLSANGGKPSDQLTKAINQDFGSVENMKNQLAAASVGVQGSGWGWLGYNKQMKKLQIATCSNQDPLQATTGLVPLFGIDVWEHAYYLQYKNVRADYVKAIFDVANWVDISTRYEKALN